jgi:uncharacterized protein YecE (DUF72 family)
VSGHVVVGTSSWADPGFVAEWYPPKLPAAEQLPYYAERFAAVEVNSTYYAIPSAKTVKRWAEVTPKDFTFDIKLHQALSRHSAQVDSLPKALRDRVDTTPRGRVRPSQALDRELARRYLRAVKPLIDAGKPPTMLPRLDAVTRDDLAYLRLHGRNARGWVKGRTVAERFGYRYDDAELEEIAQRAEGLAEEADTVRVMFNNNRGDDAPTAAQQLRALLGQEPAER